MEDIVIRDVGAAALDRLGAQTDDLSTEEEPREGAQWSVETSTGDIQADIANLRRLFAGRFFSDSTEDIIDDRSR